MKRISFPRTISKTLLAGLLAVSIQAQQADALKLIVTQGAPDLPTSKKDTKKREALPAAVIVEIRDETGRIVPGARVEVRTPASPGKPVLGWTDTEGRAYIDGVVPVGQEGKTPIVAEARFNGKLGTTTFNNTALLPPPAEITRTFTFNRQHHRLRNTLIVAGVVGATALAIALALTLPGGTKAIVPATTTTVSIGGTTVGAPQ